MTWCLAGPVWGAVVLNVSDQAIRLTPFDRDHVEVEIDGRLDEPIWDELPAHGDFRVIEPDTLAVPPYATRVRFFYTSAGLYIGVDMDQPEETLIQRLSGRDDWRVNRDAVGLTLDTSGEGRYGYWFEVALGDSIADGTLLPERQYSRNWDGPWRGASAMTPTGWSAEIMVPWGTVAMPQSGPVRQMGLYMSRKIAITDERVGWPALPWTQGKFMSALQPLEMTDVAPRQQYNLYPFFAATHDGIDDRMHYQAGADVFWRPSPNTQLMATVNPDFGTVETDELVVNLSATETFYPEKRLFFLEGQEIFVATPRAETRRRGVGRGGAPTTMVNTRRIGGPPRDREPQTLVQDLKNQDLVTPVQLYGATKVTGQTGRLRYGVLTAFEEDYSVQTNTTPDFTVFDRDGNDYGVARLLYEDSVGGAYRAIGVLSTAVVHGERDAYAQGVDWHYLTPDARFKLDGQAFVSDVSTEKTGYGGYMDFEYTFRQGVQQRVGIEYFDRNVDINDLGFLQRNNDFRIRAAHTRTTSDLGWARDNEFDLRGFVQQSDAGRLTGAGIFLSDQLTFDNLSRVTARTSYFPQSYDDLNSFGNGTYRIDSRGDLGLDFETDSSRSLQLGAGAGWYQEHLGGNSHWVSGLVKWRPSDRFNIAAEVNYDDRDGWLIHQRDRFLNTYRADQWMPSITAEYFLTARQQFRVSLQWIGIKARQQKTWFVPDQPGDLIEVPSPDDLAQDFFISDLSVQLRYRWEIAPLSDLFVVYTRLSNLSGLLRTQSFDDILNDAYHEPLVDGLIVKLRYRLGS